LIAEMVLLGGCAVGVGVGFTVGMVVGALVGVLVGSAVALGVGEFRELLPILLGEKY
jgi:hypothetical protein